MVRAVRGAGLVVRAADLAELVRLPAALTVPGDSWAGAATTAAPPSRRWAMPASSILLYWAGMALNDWADRRVDAVERPERPIPSGRVPARTALALATGLGAAGIAVSAAVGGRDALRLSVPLAALVATYDTVAKDSPAGPAVMAATRGLDVLLGAAASPRDALAPAAAIATHTVGVTVLSRGEVHGSDRATARGVVATTCAVAAAGAAATLADRSISRRDRVAAVALHAAYAAVVGRAQAQAVASPDASTVRRATGAGIGGLPLLQAAWLAGRGRPASAAVVAAALPAVRLATRRLSAT